MSEEKLYAVKNAKGLYLSMSADTLHRWREGQIDATTSQRIAHDLCTQYGGHVVTFVEEPEKVVLTKEQAEIVEGAHDFEFPASYISRCDEDEELLMNAYVNDYTVAKEKKYNVKVPLVQAQGGLWFYINSEDKLGATYLQELANKFTMDEIERYGLQGCEKVECDNDED